MSDLYVIATVVHLCGRGVGLQSCVQDGDPSPVHPSLLGLVVRWRHQLVCLLGPIVAVGPSAEQRRTGRKDRHQIETAQDYVSDLLHNLFRLVVRVWIPLAFWLVGAKQEATS